MPKKVSAPKKAAVPKNISDSQRYEELCKVAVGKALGIDPTTIVTKQKEEGKTFRRGKPVSHQLDLTWQVEDKLTITKYFADAKLHGRSVEQGFVDKIVGVRDSVGYQKAMIISPNGFTGPVAGSGPGAAGVSP
ncbi:hypothetical protein IV102_11375 [bacterium]|nr:hypothetical protein [bacterium]